MSPVSAPDLPHSGEHLRDLVSDTVDQALAATHAWQREIEARVARIEAAMSDLQLSERARAATFSAVAQPPASPTLPHPAALFPVAPSPAPFITAAPLVTHSPVTPVGRPLPVQGFDDAARVLSVFPSGIDGGRRKRTIAIVAVVILILAVGALAALAAVSHTVHGL
jgi:hypothetical protein